MRKSVGRIWRERLNKTKTKIPEARDVQDIVKTLAGYNGWYTLEGNRNTTGKSH